MRPPPPSSRLIATLTSPMVPVITTAAAAAVDNSVTAGVPEASTVVAPAAAQLLPPRQRSTSVHALTGHLPRIVPTDNSNSSSAVLGIAEGPPLLEEGRARIRSGSVAPEVPSQQQPSSLSSAGGSAAVTSSSSSRIGHVNTENQNPNTISTRDRDHNPALIAAKVGFNRNIGRDIHPATKRQHKPLTPQARPVKSVSRVTAELVSRGPAAVLRDRTAPVHRDVQITPSRFAPAVPVAQGAVVVLDDYLNNNNNNNSTGDIAPTAEQGGGTSMTISATCTPRSSSNSSSHETNAVAITTGVFSPTALAMSPALAFLCSPRTTEMLLEQEDRASAAVATPFSAVRGGGGIRRGSSSRDHFENHGSASSAQEEKGEEDTSPRCDSNNVVISSSSMHQHESAVTETEGVASSSASIVVAPLEEVVEEEKEEEEKEHDVDQGQGMIATATVVQAVTLDDLPCSLNVPPPLDSHTLLSSNSVPVFRKQQIQTIGSTPSMTTRLSLSSVAPQTRTITTDTGCCYVPLPFIQPPDSAPPTARLTARLGYNDNDVMTASGMLSPWTDSTLAEVHFTQNGRRLSFSNRDADQQQQQSVYDETMVVSEFLPLFGSPVALT